MIKKRLLQTSYFCVSPKEDGPWLKVGSFVYEDDSFRYLGKPTLAPDWRSFYAGYDKPFEP